MNEHILLLQHEQKQSIKARLWSKQTDLRPEYKQRSGLEPARGLDRSFSAWLLALTSQGQKARSDYASCPAFFKDPTHSKHSTVGAALVCFVCVNSLCLCSYSPLQPKSEIKGRSALPCSVSALWIKCALCAPTSSSHRELQQPLCMLIHLSVFLRHSSFPFLSAVHSLFISLSLPFLSIVSSHTCVCLPPLAVSICFSLYLSISLPLSLSLLNVNCCPWSGEESFKSITEMSSPGHYLLL